MQKIAVDLLELDKQEYVVTVDVYSKFFEVSHLPNSESKTVINYIKPQLARYGISEIIVCDNGPEFSIHEFSEFAKQYGLKHITSSAPRYPQSNGLAERAIQTADNIRKKAKVEGKDYQLGLLASPAQMLMGRRTKNQLPTTPALLEPQYPNGNIKNGLSRRAEIQQQHYNRNAKVLKPLNTGDTVRVRKPGEKTWTSAVITRVTDAPRSYVVNSEGTSYRRNRRDLIKTTEAKNQQQRLEDSETNTTSSVHDPVSSEKVISKGRIIRPPVWFKDYVTD